MSSRVLAMVFALATGALAVEKGFLWDGTHWKDMSHDLKVAYVWGIGNMADLKPPRRGPPHPAPLYLQGFCRRTQGENHCPGDRCGG